MRVSSTLVLAALLLPACAPAPDETRQPGPRGQPGAPEPSQQMVGAAAEDLREFRRAFLDWYFENHPVRASRLGIHAYDARLPALTRTAVQRRIEALLERDAALRRIPFPLLQGELRYDYAVMEYAIRSELLELEETRRWAADPALYTAAIADGLASLVEWPAGAEADRLEALRSRLLEAPGLLEAARENVSSPPRVWVDLAIGDARGLLEYVERGRVAEVVDGAGPAAADGLAEARSALVAALEEHLSWLEDDLLPGASGNFRLGRYLFLRKLLLEEHVDLSVEELERLNRDAMAEYSRRLAAVAERIDPDPPVGDLIDSLMAAHPAAGDVVPTAREMVEAARTWPRLGELVPLAEGAGAGAGPEVREAPEYVQGRLSVLETPGPLGPPSSDAYLGLVLPDTAGEEMEGYLRAFNRYGLAALALHQAYPGAYVQQVAERRAESTVRKAFTPRSFEEGWASYAEQMALEEGFAADDLAVRLLHLRRALQEHALWQAVIDLHVHGMEVDDVVTRFMETAHAPEAVARQAVRRATRDAMALAPALGRLQILELREDMRTRAEEADEAFSLFDFHQRVLELVLPLALTREALIPPPPERPREIYRR